MAEKKLTGRIAADRIRMQSTPKPPAGAVERFLALGECTSLISDVMDELGVPEGTIGATRAQTDAARQADRRPGADRAQYQAAVRSAGGEDATSTAWPSSRRITSPKTATCW